MWLLGVQLRPPTSTDELIAAYTKAYDSGDEAAIRKLFVQGTSSPDDFEDSITDAMVGIGKYKVVDTDITDLTSLSEEQASLRDELEFGYPVAKAVEVQVDAKEPHGPGEEPSRWMLLAVSEEGGHSFLGAGRMK